MASKPLIGVNADRRPAQSDAPSFAFLDAGYFDSISKAGA
ncbi:hypothetical protein LCGC14_2902050, partial [marine sediment metagenome]